MFGKNKVLIIPHDGKDPTPALYAVKFGRGRLERAMGVMVIGRVWHVHLDGLHVAEPHTDWRKAFGKFAYDTLIGRVIGTDEYERLLRNRMRDAASGLDITQPPELNKVRIPNLKG
jgi:hypothetical protein